MLAAVINFHRTGDLDLWPVYIAYSALGLPLAGLSALD